MKLVSIAAALALACLGVVANSQTADVTLATCLPDGNNDGIIDVSATGSTTYKIATGRWYVVEGTPAPCTYSRTKPVPTPEPTPTPTPTPTPEPTQPAAVISLAGPEALARVGDTVFGWNKFGGMGTEIDAPAEFWSTGQKFRRKGFFVGGLDIIIPGTPLDSMSAAYTLNGVRYTHGNQPFIGVNPTPGLFTADGTWSAQIGPFLVHKKLTPGADGLSQVVTFSNTSGQVLSNVVIMFAQDPDNGDTGDIHGVTSNKIVSRGLVTAKLASGKTHSLSTTHINFKAGMSPLIVSGNYLPNKPDAVTPQAVGYSLRADRNVYLRGIFPTVGAEPIIVPVEMTVR